MHLSINFCGYVFFDKIFLSLLHSSGIKLMKLVYNTLNVSVIKTLVTNLSFSRNIFTSRKESDPSTYCFEYSIKDYFFLCNFATDIILVISIREI